MGVASCRSAFLCLTSRVRLVLSWISIRDWSPFEGRACRGFRSAKWPGPTQPNPAQPGPVWPGPRAPGIPAHLPMRPLLLSLSHLDFPRSNLPLPLPPLSPRGALGFGVEITRIWIPGGEFYPPSPSLLPLPFFFPCAPFPDPVARAPAGPVPAAPSPSRAPASPAAPSPRPPPASHPRAPAPAAAPSLRASAARAPAPAAVPTPVEPLPQRAPRLGCTPAAASRAPCPVPWPRPRPRPCPRPCLGDSRLARRHVRVPPARAARSRECDRARAAFNSLLIHFNLFSPCAASRALPRDGLFSFHLY
jgi:hypothetical protein